MRFWFGTGIGRSDSSNKGGGEMSTMNKIQVEKGLVALQPKMGSFSDEELILYGQAINFCGPTLDLGDESKMMRLRFAEYALLRLNNRV
jgi:hypothetical protein